MVLLEMIPTICLGVSLIGIYVALNLITFKHKLSNSYIYWIVFVLGIILSALSLALYSAIFASCLCVYSLIELVMIYFLHRIEDALSKDESSFKFF